MPAKGGHRKRPKTDSNQSRGKWLEPKSLRVNRVWNLTLTPSSDRLKANSSWTVWSRRSSAARQYWTVHKVEYQVSTTTAKAAYGRPQLRGGVLQSKLTV